MDETLKSALIECVIARATDLRSDIHLDKKYGGTVFMLDSDTPSSLVGGVFAYKDYVSVEFSNGATFEDPQGHLEGKGKARRHVKLHSLADLDAKTLSDFLAQALV